ncbi:hypothetical protein ACFSKJ_02140 [Tabrizicola soli]|uniref:hypothetical protein n=1 Tax=Tabrizicola soli TaxID=2185115 RepID=UPI003628EE3B
MQDRYAGDVGDFVKLGLLRAIAPGRTLGVAWYRYPDEGHNGDGRHTDYLRDRNQKLAQLDPELFEHLSGVVRTARSIRSLLPILGDARSSDEALDVVKVPVQRRRSWRASWFDRVMGDLDGCDLVFADPDNGLTDDDDRRKGRATFGKSLPISEALRLSEGRAAVIYHHNTRRAGGHDAEVDHWMSVLGAPCLAVRARAYNCRTFFIVNPDQRMEDDIRRFCDRWSILKVSLHTSR